MLEPLQIQDGLLPEDRAMFDLVEANSEWLERLMVERLCEGFARPNGRFFWTMYLSEISREARKLGADFLRLERKDYWLRCETAQYHIFRAYYDLVNRHLECLPPGYRGRMKTAKKGSHIVNCGDSESRDYTAFSTACESLVKREEARRLADPDMLRHYFNEYVDALVKANNAAQQSRFKCRSPATKYEVSYMRSYSFSDNSMLKIAESPIAALFLSAKAQ